MTDSEVDHARGEQALANKLIGNPNKPHIRPRLRRAIEAMVWQAAKRADAASIAGMTDHSLRAALKRPHVSALLLHEMMVLRTSERPRNIQALVSVRDNSENDMARVNAAKTLEALSDEATDRARGTVVLPGLTIQIVNAVPSSPNEVIEAKPLITQGDE